MEDEIFGSEPQQTLLKRGQDTFALVRDDPRFTYYGRTVGVADHTDESNAILTSLARLQGAAHYGCVDDRNVLPLIRNLKDRGYSTTHYVRWVSGENTFGLAEAAVSDYPLPPDVRVISLGPNSPKTDLQKLADIALSCEVLPPSGAVLRGVARPALTFFGC